MLERLPAVECHLLGFLAQPDEAEAEVGLGALLPRVEADERAADAVGDEAAAERVDNRGPYQRGRNVERLAAERDRERRGQRPQNTDEGEESDGRVQQPARERERPARDQLEVFGDTLIGVVGAAVDALEMVVGAVTEPTAEEFVGEPPPPPHLERLGQVLPVDRRDDE
jgi:hypothetical protein